MSFDKKTINQLIDDGLSHWKSDNKHLLWIDNSPVVVNEEDFRFIKADIENNFLLNEKDYINECIFEKYLMNFCGILAKESAKKENWRLCLYFCKKAGLLEKTNTGFNHWEIVINVLEQIVPRDNSKDNFWDGSTPICRVRNISKEIMYYIMQSLNKTVKSRIGYFNFYNNSKIIYSSSQFLKVSESVKSLSKIISYFQSEDFDKNKENSFLNIETSMILDEARACGIEIDPISFYLESSCINEINEPFETDQPCYKYS